MNTQNKTNLSLIFGLLILLITMIITFFGPSIAPRDPLAQESLLYFNGEWDTPPYLPGTPGYPFGADEFGRDILSRLFWAVQPTIKLIFIAASIRILLGLLFGMVASGKNAFFASLANTSISYALALPILLIAFTIMLPYKGSPTPPFWPFIFALTLTGWAEVAQIVRDEVFKLKQQAFIEAAQSLGASPWNIFKNHILKHLTPLMLIMINFELASTLLLTSTLGFLGFYLGGETSEETVAGGTVYGSAYPDLGEMLSTTINIPIQPWGLVVAGSTVFIIIFGFNLVGHGLRQQLKNQQTRALKGWQLTIFNWRMELDQRLAYPLQNFGIKFRRPLQAITAILLIVLAYSWVQENQPRVQREIAQIQREAAYLSEEWNLNGAASDVIDAGEAEILWTMAIPESLSAPPDLSIPGQVLLYRGDDVLQAYSTEGEYLWKTDVPQNITAFGYETIAERITFPTTSEGVIYIFGYEGIQAITINGEFLWENALSNMPRQGTSFNSYRCCTVGQRGRFYWLDSRNNLQVFDPYQGFLWEYQATTEIRPDFYALYLGANDAVYILYFPTFESNAHIVALSPNGEYYWDIEYPVESVFYYDEHSVRSSIDLHFYESYMLSNRYVFSSEDGRLLFELSRSDIELPQEIVNTLDNPQQFLNTWEESELDFITGESGEVYILSSFYNPQTSDSHNYLMEISLQDQSIEVISINQTVLGNTSEQINNNGIIVSYWAFANFMRISNLSPPYQNTEIILDENTYSLFNNETGQVLACDADRDTAVTTCIYYPPFETEIHFSIEGVTSIYRWSMDWENGILYLFDRRKVLHVIQCPIP